VQTLASSEEEEEEEEEHPSTTSSRRGRRPVPSSARFFAVASAASRSPRSALSLGPCCGIALLLKSPYPSIAPMPLLRRTKRSSSSGEDFARRSSAFRQEPDRSAGRTALPGRRLRCHVVGKGACCGNEDDGHWPPPLPV